MMLVMIMLMATTAMEGVTATAAANVSAAEDQQGAVAANTRGQQILSWSPASSTTERVTGDVFNALNVTPTNMSDHNPNNDRDPLSLVIPITICYAAIFVAGVLGNVITCTVICRNKSMHTATNYYLFNLAISDLLLLVCGMPPDIYKIWYPMSYPFGTAFCIMQGLISETSANATVLTITSFTVERYLAICRPFVSHKMSTLSRAVKFIFAIWVLAFCLAVPQSIQFGIVTFSDGGTICSIKNSLIDHAFEVSSFVFFLLPMTVICVLYCLIGYKLHQSKLLQGVKRKGCDTNRNGISGQSRVIRMLVAVVVAFFLCWAPFHGQRLMAVYGSSTSSQLFYNVYAALTYLSGILYFLSTCINPLLYNIMSHKFRDAFKATLARHCRFGGGVGGNGRWHQQDRRHNYSAIARGGPTKPGSGVSPINRAASVRTNASARLNEAELMIRATSPPDNNLVGLIENCNCFPSTASTSHDNNPTATREDVGQIMEHSFHDNGDANNNTNGRKRENSILVGLTPTISALTTAANGKCPVLATASSPHKPKPKRFSWAATTKCLFKFNTKKQHHRNSCDTAATTTTSSMAGGDKRRLQKLNSVDSANTISNSSLQEVDDEEFNSSDLVKYMEEINIGITRS